MGVPVASEPCIDGDEMSDYHSAWYQANKERIKQKYRDNSTRIKALAKEHYNRTRASNPKKIMLRNIQSRCIKRGIEFNLTVDDFEIPEICPVLGIELKPFSNSDNSPSIDRINPDKGYTKDNIQVMSTKANRMKTNASPEELKAFAEWVLKNV